MHTVIVPLDFSQTSFNAAHYAANMFKDRQDVRLILYHFYVAGEDIAAEKKYLQSLKEELVALVPHVETELESGGQFITSCAAFAHVMRAELIVMGLYGKTPKEQRFSGSNTLKMSEKEICPVLIIPEHASFKGISNVMISSELKSVEETPSLMAVKRVLRDFKPAVHILHVDSNVYVSLPPALQEERDKMHSILSEFNPEFYFMRLFDFHDSVDAFAKDKNIDMIVIAPKFHGIYARLFKTQHTKKLVYQSSVPILTVHE